MAFCINCGAPLVEGAKFCAKCGTAVPAENVADEEPMDYGLEEGDILVALQENPEGYRQIIIVKTFDVDIFYYLKKYKQVTTIGDSIPLSRTPEPESELMFGCAENGNLCGLMKCKMEGNTKIYERYLIYGTEQKEDGSVEFSFDEALKTFNTSKYRNLDNTFICLKDMSPSQMKEFF